MFVDNMDSNHILVLDNGCEKVLYKRMYNVWSEYPKIPKLELSTWIKNGINVFYLHCITNNKTVHEDFSKNIMADIINVIENQYDSDLGKHEISYYKTFNDVGEHLPTLLMTAVGVSKSKYVNMLVDQFEKDNFILCELPVAKVHHEEQIKDVHKNIKKNLPPSCSHIIFTFIYRYRDESMESYDTLILHFIESLTYNYPEQVKPDTRDLLMRDVRKIFKDLEISDEHMACVFYMDKTNILQGSEHIFSFFKTFLKIPEDDKKKKEATLKTLHRENDSILIDKLVEVMADNVKLKASLRQLEGKYKELTIKLIKNKELYKNTMKKEVIEKLTASHNERMQSQGAKFDEINNRLKINYQEKLEAMEKFYEKYVRNCREQYEKLYEAKNLLRFEKSNLEKETMTLNTKLRTMQGGALPTSFEVPEALTEDDDFKHRMADISNMIQDTETSQLYKSKIQDLQLKSDKLSEEIIQKQNDVDNLIQQIKFYKLSQEESEKTKQELEAENAGLLRTIEDIQTRHTEQFRIYEKLVEKSRKETDVQKREVARLREHLSSENSPLRLPQNTRIPPVNRRHHLGRDVMQQCCTDTGSESKIPAPPPLPSEVGSTPNNESRKITLTDAQKREAAKIREILNPKRLVPNTRIASVHRSRQVERTVIRQCCSEKDPDSIPLKLPTPPPLPSEVGSTNGVTHSDTSAPTSKSTCNELNSDLPVFSKWLKNAEKASHELDLPNLNQLANPLFFSMERTTPKSKTNSASSNEPACIKWLRSMEKAKSKIDSRLLQLCSERANTNESTQKADVDNATDAEPETTVSKRGQPRKHGKRGRPKKKNFRKK